MSGFKANESTPKTDFEKKKITTSHSALVYNNNEILNWFHDTVLFKMLVHINRIETAIVVGENGITFVVIAIICRPTTIYILFISLLYCLICVPCWFSSHTHNVLCRNLVQIWYDICFNIYAFIICSTRYSILIIFFAQLETSGPPPWNSLRYRGFASNVYGKKVLWESGKINRCQGG